MGKLAKRFPAPLARAAERADEYARGLLTGGTLFEELGFYYVGPIDGHDLDALLPVLRNLRDADEGQPVLLHVVTKKGKGYAPAESAPDKYHGVQKFNVVTGEQQKAPPGPPAYTRVFANALIAEAERDDRIVAVTAAMPSGTGLDLFGKRFPKRTFDVGIAEQHGVTFAAGMATEGMKPFCVIYSTFLQRAYDQVMHDVALQNLPVRFAMDRAGLVGADGATHAGSFDIAYLGCLPNMVLMAPADEVELVHMTATAAAHDAGPIAFRYPRGEGTGLAALPQRGEILPIGKGRILREGTAVALLSYGTRLAECLKAADELAAQGLSCTVADARFAKPLDTALVEQLARHHGVLVTIEEGSVGGFGSFVAQHLAWKGLLDGGLRFRPMVLPDRYIDHNNPRKQYDEAALNAAHVVATVQSALGSAAGARRWRPPGREGGSEGGGRGARPARPFRPRRRQDPRRPSPGGPWPRREPHPSPGADPGRQGLFRRGTGGQAGPAGEAGHAPPGAGARNTPGSRAAASSWPMPWAISASSPTGAPALMSAPPPAASPTCC